MSLARRGRPPRRMHRSQRSRSRAQQMCRLISCRDVSHIKRLAVSEQGDRCTPSVQFSNLVALESSPVHGFPIRVLIWSLRRNHNQGRKNASSTFQVDRLCVPRHGCCVGRGCRIVCSWFVDYQEPRHGSLPRQSDRLPTHVPARRRLRWLASVRWPEGFDARAAAITAGRYAARHVRVRALPSPASVTAGTILHGSKLALTVWFWAAYLMATHSNGIAALQLQNQLGIGSYRSAWLLAAKLRKAMVDPEPTRCRASSRSTRPRWRSAPRMIPWPAAPGAATTASCSSSAPSRSATATRRAACAWPRSRPTAPKASTASSATTSPPPAPPRPTAGPATPRPPSRPTIPTSWFHGRPPRAALDPSGVLQSQGLGARPITGCGQAPAKR